ncbi:ATP-binding protein [Streptomyces sp. Go40/10]|uniref:sensor histidine kinase n=1 Tax=Streptomyces sp. Go40/10 TaxID=2825844 RepID=UPI001E45E42E|nr:ATP-binding protein [Streptomyces sp. Go40/10]UFQ99780.1 ATP-binding protein [Streptomyces sp. Go40/10]
MTLAQRVATPRGLRRRLHLTGVLPGLCALLVLLGAGPVVGQSVCGQVVWGGAAVVCGFVCVVAWRMSGSTAAAVDEAEKTRRQREADHVARMRAGLPAALNEIQVLVDQVRRGEPPQVRDVHPEAPAEDPLTVLAGDLSNFVREVQLYVATSSASRVRDALLILGRRTLSLTTAAISDFDPLEETIEDPDVLGPLFRLDHKVTRVRRFAESLVIVGGGAPRESRQPDELSLVIRHAMQEVEQYARVTVVTPVDTLVRGRVTAGLVHLLAELIDNAANFSPPDQPVTVRVSQVHAGFAIEVEDRGSPIPAPTLERLNQLLADPSSRFTGEYVRDGRLGLWVVSLLAKRFGVRVRLQPNAFGANTAVAVLPVEQLHTDEETSTVLRSPSALLVRHPSQRGVGDGARETPAETTLALAAVDRAGRLPVAGGHSAPEHPAQPVAPLPRRSTAREQQVPGSGGKPPLARREASQSYSHPQLRAEQVIGDGSPAAPDPNLARSFFAGPGRAAVERGVDRNAARPEPTNATPRLEDDRVNPHP